ncbi:Zinc finger, AN1-type [Corchorus olitorius]|uniref:Zinc finger, AN1-type n=1 Tax=Corchorus olitorius TaxID=93759 RepID=A0A1R3G8K0_9ROSI|nr:Zinc finger, AN1-type [Corchorus olitorius]
MATMNRPLTLCAKGCGRNGWAETKNLCSWCYFESIKEDYAKSKDKIIAVSEGSPFPFAAAYRESLKLKSNRCQCCNKKVGLTGFWCRCGKVLCGIHRYPIEHSYAFDFKTADRLVLAKQNPLLKPDKLDTRI